MTKQIHILLIAMLILLGLRAYSQDTISSGELLQFTGVVVTADSLNPVPYASISIKDSYRGTITDYFGYFSFVARKNDTIQFSSMGFKKATFIIPDTVTEQRYSLIQMLTPDTLLLVETVIYPWPSKDQFKEAFLNLNIPDDDLEIARRNLDPRLLAMKAANYGMDGSMNYRNMIQNQTAKLYYAGQVQPYKIFDVFAWAKFIKAWKEGKFRRKKNK